jgi:hypothetical protein
MKNQYRAFRPEGWTPFLNQVTKLDKFLSWLHRVFKPEKSLLRCLPCFMIVAPIFVFYVIKWRVQEIRVKLALAWVSRRRRSGNNCSDSAPTI